MDEKQSRISQFFKRSLGRKSPEQSNTPLAAQTPSEEAPPSRDNVPSQASSEHSAPVAPAAPPNKVVSPAGGVIRLRIAGGRVPAVWKVGDMITIENEVMFEVAGQLGEGGMGLVYKVYSRRHNASLAMKCPKPEIFAKAGGQENFIREAETWINLGEYPHIVRCGFVKMLGDLPNIFAEYVDGGSLADWIRQRTLYKGRPE